MDELDDRERGKGGRGMTRIQKSIVIEVPVAEAFEFAADWRNATRFYEGHTISSL
jgi:hypothetical protein